MPVVIVENDTSQWEDQTGAVYHFPKRYQNWLAQGTDVIYYKGRIQDKAFASARLSNAPHYFAKARIGKVYADKGSTKGDLFALIEGFTPFEQPVAAQSLRAQYRCGRQLPRHELQHRPLALGRETRTLGGITPDSFAHLRDLLPGGGGAAEVAPVSRGVGVGCEQPGVRIHQLPPAHGHVA